ncbi:MAG: tetratricopeptide repeat protein [Candidatus Thorarchaeota archaeon]
MIICRKEKKYAEQMFEDAKYSSENKEKLLDLAENTLVNLLKDHDVECIDPETGYILSRLGQLKMQQNDYDMAQQYFKEALSNLIVRGEFCQDRALSHLGLAISYRNLNNQVEAKNHFIKAIHIYDSLAMYKELHEKLEPHFNDLGYKIEDFLPAKEITPEGKPVQCRECGKKEFKLVEETSERWIYECVACGCRNVVLAEMIQNAIPQ